MRWKELANRSVILLFLVGSIGATEERQVDTAESVPRPSYNLSVDIDVTDCSFWGESIVRYTHAGKDPLNDIWFLLYPNISARTEKDAPPLLFVRTVEIAGAAVKFQVHRSTSLQVSLPRPLRSGEEVELRVGFFGRIPELGAASTSLATHFTEQISQVIGSRQQRAYWKPPLFKVDRIMVLSDFYPTLARRQGKSWLTTVRRGVDDVFEADAADYQVAVRVPEGISVYTSGRELGSGRMNRRREFRFQGQSLRKFLIIAGPGYEVASRQVGSVEVQSVFLPQDAVVGRAVLGYAVNALTVYQNRFGPYPYPHLRVIEAPLPAGWMSSEAACIIGLARAYYVDFQSRRAAHLPSLIRESAEQIEEALEFNVAYAVARQWWGMLVEFDPEHAHFLDNALATYAALTYYKETYGPDVARAQRESQLTAAYRVYRMFGGHDMAANLPVDRFSNSFQYAAIVHVKGALFLDAVRQLIGDDAFFMALKNYFQAHRYGHADVRQLLRELRLAAGTDGDQISHLYKRWITWRRGDQDIATPEFHIIVSTDLQPSRRDHPSAFEWLGRFIGRQMGRVGKYAAKPF